MSRLQQILIQAISCPLVKAIPLLSTYPFQAGHAISAGNAPVLGCHIQENECECYDEKCHSMPSFDPFPLSEELLDE
jgi:hypothetical protein